jgi:hypothetical protein
MGSAETACGPTTVKSSSSAMKAGYATAHRAELCDLRVSTRVATCGADARAAPASGHHHQGYAGDLDLQVLSGP